MAPAAGAPNPVSPGSTWGYRVRRHCGLIHFLVEQCFDNATYEDGEMELFHVSRLVNSNNRCGF